MIFTIPYQWEGILTLYLPCLLFWDADEDVIPTVGSRAELSVGDADLESDDLLSCSPDLGVLFSWLSSVDSVFDLP